MPPRLTLDLAPMNFATLPAAIHFMHSHFFADIDVPFSVVRALKVEMP
jgi:hypothetical protein